MNPLTSAGRRLLRVGAVLGMLTALTIGGAGTASALTTSPDSGKVSSTSCTRLSCDQVQRAMGVRWL